MRETEVTPWSAIKLNGFQALFDIFRSILRNFGHRMHAGRRVSGLGPYSKALRFGLGFFCLPPARTDGVWTCLRLFGASSSFWFGAGLDLHRSLPTVADCRARLSGSPAGWVCPAAVAAGFND